MKIDDARGMGMRETSRSMRTYFLLVGAVGLVRALVVVAQLEQVSERAASAGMLLALAFQALSLLGFGIAFLIVGLGLPSALRRGAVGAQRTLLGAFLVGIANGVLALTLVGGDETGALIGAVVQMAVTTYLLVNVRRLASEAREVDGPVAIARK